MVTDLRHFLCQSVFICRRWFCLLLIANRQIANGLFFGRSPANADAVNFDNQQLPSVVIHRRLYLQIIR